MGICFEYTTRPRLEPGNSEAQATAIFTHSGITKPTPGKEIPGSEEPLKPGLWTQLGG